MPKFHDAFYQNLKKIALPMPTGQGIRFFGFFLSLILSLIWYSYQQPVNPDAITYVHAAQIFLTHGLKASIHIYNWPLYPLLIAFISKITQLSLLNSAHLLNALLIAVTLVAFVSIVKNLGASKTIQTIACLVFLLYTPLGHERFMIVRDFGYYAFGLLAVNYLIRYQTSARYFSLLSWSVFMTFAALFRSEGFVFLVLIPFLFFFDTRLNFKKRTLTFLKANTLLIIVILLGGLLLFSFMEQNALFFSFQHMWTNKLSALSAMINNYHKSIWALQKYVISPFSPKQASYFYAAGPLGFFFVLLVQTLGYVYTILYLYSWKYKVFNINAAHSLILNAFIIINLLVLFLFAYSRLFLTTRYIMFLALVLILRVPYVIYDIYQRFPAKFFQAKTWRWQPFLLNISLAILLISSLFHFGADRNFVIKTQHWANSHISKQSRVLVNGKVLSFYVNLPGKTVNHLLEKIEHDPKQVLQQMQKFNYVIFEASNRQTASAENFIQKNKLNVIKVFINNHQDKIFILNTSEKSPLKY